MKFTLCFFQLAVFLLAGYMPLAGADTSGPTDCDIEAAHPSDPHHVGTAKSSDEVDTVRAIAACRVAVEKSPDEARFHYQLGRALVYSGQFEEGKGHVRHAADMNYMQAQFVLALLSKDKPCEAQTLIKAAADQGLKSARITYVSDFLSGTYEACPASASQDEMSAYLDAAGSQMDGYYEMMLWTALVRESKQ